MLKLLLLTVLILSIQAHSNKKCGHESQQIQDHYRALFEKHEKSGLFDQTNQNLRVLQQNADAQQIRITVDYSTIDRFGSGGITPQQKNYLIKIMETSKLYFQRLLKVYPIQGNNKFPSLWGTTCIDLDVPQKDIDVGIPNSDLHLYVIYVNDRASTFIANAGFCGISTTGSQRPIFGRVNFNLAQLRDFTGDPETFENDLETTIHEITHVLGFSGYSMAYWIDPDTGKPYGRNTDKITSQETKRGKTTGILFSKNVLDVTRRYYNCPNASGMQIENEGGQGSLGSHWERTVIYNEMMTGAAVSTDAVLSVFTIALLKDTGFYAEVNENMADSIFWGKGKGCNFLDQACYSNQKFPEFPDNSSEAQCSFEYEGVGTGVKDQFADSCKIIYPYYNSLCSNPKNQIDPQTQSSKYQDEIFAFYSSQSRCFTSSAQIPSGYKYQGKQMRCHKFECSPDASQITIIFPQANNYKVVCNRSQQGKFISIDETGKTISGQIQCPEDFNRFCNFTPVCENYCSANGICVKGTCICQSGFAGNDCSRQCSGALEDGKCVNQCTNGKFLNSDNTCKTTCPIGYYGRNGKCEQCHSSCSQCRGPTQNDCTACQYLSLLQENQCVSQCDSKKGYFVSPVGQRCLNQSSKNCKGNCDTCDNNQTAYCYSCKSGFFMDKSNQCLQTCPQGFFGNKQTSTCDQALEGCTSQQSSFECLVCDSSKGYRLGNDKACTLCAKDCNQCNKQNPQICFQCENRLFLSNGKCLNQCPESTYTTGQNNECLQCPQGCKGCTDQYTCTSCVEGSYLDTYYKTCRNCSQYIQNCVTCDYDSCQKCQQGYDLSPNKRYCQSKNQGGQGGQGGSGGQSGQGGQGGSGGTSPQGCTVNEFYDSYFKKCVRCSDKIFQCSQCSSDSICNRCEVGWILSPTQRGCYQDNSGGGNNGNGGCPNSFYYDQNEARCIKCENKIAFCTECSASNVCSKCLPGYILSTTLRGCYQGQNYEGFSNGKYRLLKENVLKN